MAIFSGSFFAEQFWLGLSYVFPNNWKELLVAFAKHRWTLNNLQNFNQWPENVYSSWFLELIKKNFAIYPPIS